MLEFRKQLLYFGYKLARKIGFVSLMNLNFEGASVLMYHKVNDQDGREINISPDLFEEVIDYLTREYKIISLESLVEKLKEKRKINKGTIVITFDDGYRDSFVNGGRVLKKYGVAATFFIASGYVGSNRVFPWEVGEKRRNEVMDWDDVRELAKMGFEIGGHTINHVNLGEVSVDEAEREIKGCREKIEEEIGQEVNKFAYPYGRKEAIRKEIVDLVKKAGFKCCCSGYGGKVLTGSDRFNLQRIGMYPNLIELLMEIDNFYTFINGRMKFGR